MRNAMFAFSCSIFETMVSNRKCSSLFISPNMEEKERVREKAGRNEEDDEDEEKLVSKFSSYSSVDRMAMAPLEKSSRYHEIRAHKERTYQFLAMYNILFMYFQSGGTYT